MVKVSSFWKRFIVVVLILASFGATATPARADLTSIVGNAGPVLAAAISCSNVEGRLSNIFKKQVKVDPEEKAAEKTSVNTAIKSNTKGAAAEQKAAVSTSTKLTCTQAIEKAAAQVILRQLTLKTINWINHGFKDGGSIFIGDEASFLKNIRNKSINSFTEAIGANGNKGLYPFGNMVAAEIVNHTKNYFEQNAIYSLDRVIASKHPGVDPRTVVSSFQKNFAYGGWDAFDAQFDTNNNPVGFSMAAKNELVNRVADTQYSDAQDIKDQLQRNQGFLDLKKCISSYTNENVTCTKWQTATPGSIIAQQLDTALGSNYRQLELGQDLSSDITAIFNALANQLVQKGLASLEGTKTGNSENNTTYVSNITVNGINTNFTSAGDASDFDVLKDLPKIIVREKAYINELNKQNDEIKKLIPTIYRLDMCIPGPHPGWEADVEKNLNDFINDDYQLPKNSDSAISTGAKIFSGITDPLGFFKEWGKGLTADKRNEKMYSQILSELLGIGIEKDYKVNGYDVVSSGLQTLLSRYEDAIHARYKKLPPQAAEARKEFETIPKYEANISSNEDEISSVDSLLYQVCRLNRRVKALPASIRNPISGTGGTNTSTSTPGIAASPIGQVYAAALDIDTSVDNGPTLEEQADIICTSYLSGNEPKTNNTPTTELASIRSIFSLLAPDLHLDNDVIKAKDLLDQLGTVYEKINEPVSGLLDSCIAVTSDPGYTYPTTRINYKASQYFSGNPDGLPTSGTFLPYYEYGTPNYTEIPTTYNKKGDVTGTRVTSNTVISVWDLFTVSTGNRDTSNELRPFEQLIGNY